MTTSALWELAAARFMVAQLGVIVGLFMCAALGTARPLALLAVCLVTVAYAARLPAAFAAALSVAAWAYFDTDTDSSRTYRVKTCVAHGMCRTAPFPSSGRWLTPTITR